MSIATFVRESRDKISSLFFSVTKKTEYSKEEKRDSSLTTATARRNSAAF
jgi:hypothetical protein